MLLKELRGAVSNVAFAIVPSTNCNKSLWSGLYDETQSLKWKGFLRVIQMPFVSYRLPEKQRQSEPLSRKLTDKLHQCFNKQWLHCQSVFNFSSRCFCQATASLLHYPREISWNECSCENVLKNALPRKWWTRKFFKQIEAKDWREKKVVW